MVEGKQKEGQIGVDGDTSGKMTSIYGRTAVLQFVELRHFTKSVGDQFAADLRYDDSL